MEIKQVAGLAGLTEVTFTSNKILDVDATLTRYDVKVFDGETGQRVAFSRSETLIEDTHGKVLVSKTSEIFQDDVGYFQ